LLSQLTLSSSEDNIPLPRFYGKGIAQYMHSSYNFKPEYSVEKTNSGQHLVDEITDTHRTIPIFCTTLTSFSERQQPSKNIGLGKKEKYKGTNNDIQNIHIKLKIDNTNPTKNWG
jgi:hypothetical protein